MLKQFKSTSLADQVFDRLENDIIQGVYPKGEILTELKLVEQLGVSRTPIREALRRLEQEHLIEDAGKGSRVIGISEAGVRDIMDIREKIIEILTEMKGEEDWERTDLVSADIIDSFDVVVMVGEFNDAFDIELGPEHLTEENFNSVDTMVALVNKLLED